MVSDKEVAIDMSYKPRKRPSNPKRRIAQHVPIERREMMISQATYSGSPQHKRNPGDFGLTPPAQPRPGASLCDEAGIESKRQAIDLLKRGIDAGMVSETLGAGGRWPKHIWAVSKSGIPFEAQLGNPESGTYHG